MNRPEYCMIPDDGQPGCEGPCPGCGATVAGNDPVRGVCQTVKNGPAPQAFLDLVLVDDHGRGKIVASVSAYH